MGTILFLLFFVLIIAILYYCLNQNTKDIQLNRIKVYEDTEAKINLLQLSDLHLENISISPEELFHQLKDEPIDLIAITGDFLDRKRTMPKLIPYLNQLNKLQPKYGMYAVLGNHDYFLSEKNVQKLMNILESHHCKVLCNEALALSINGTRVNIIGIDDFHSNRSDIRKSYEHVKKGMNLVLTHDPNIVLHMNHVPFDYLISGHFHGGQICYPKAFHLMKMGKLPKMNITKGFHYYNGRPFYINEGLGQTGLNIRLGSRPEITIHEIGIKGMEKAASQVV